ncbi:MAG TPA: hypothetical protein VGR71_04400 [Nitrospira sp.]|nr:hypothetical protein [Nitrospira sp.]
MSLNDDPQFSWTDNVTYSRCARNAAMVLMQASVKADTTYAPILVDVANGWMRLAELAAANPPNGERKRYTAEGGADANDT